MPPCTQVTHSSPAQASPQPGRGTGPSSLLVIPSLSPSHGVSVPRLFPTLLVSLCCLSSVGLSLHLCLPLAPCHMLPVPHPRIFSFSLGILCCSLSVFCVSFNPRALVLCYYFSYPAPRLCFLCLFLSKATFLSHSSSLLSLPDVSLCLCLSHSHSSSPSLLLLSPQPYSPSLSPHPSQPAPSLSHPHIPTHPSLAVGTQGGMGQGHSKSWGRGARIRWTQASLFLFFLSNDWLLSWEADEKSLNRDLKH